MRKIRRDAGTFRLLCHYCGKYGNANTTMVYLGTPKGWAHRACHYTAETKARQEARRPRSLDRISNTGGETEWQNQGVGQDGK